MWIIFNSPDNEAYGPFDSEDDAEEYAVTYLGLDGYMILCMIKPSVHF